MSVRQRRRRRKIMRMSTTDHEHDDDHGPFATAGRTDTLTG